MPRKRTIHVGRATREKLKASVRTQRRETIYKMAFKKNDGFVACYCCGEHVTHKDATLEHILPSSKGGTDDMDNLAISHKRCNQNRGNEALTTTMKDTFN